MDHQNISTLSRQTVPLVLSKVFNTGTDTSWDFRTCYWNKDDLRMVPSCSWNNWKVLNSRRAFKLWEGYAWVQLGWHRDLNYGGQLGHHKLLGAVSQSPYTQTHAAYHHKYGSMPTQEATKSKRPRPKVFNEYPKKNHGWRITGRSYFLRQLPPPFSPLPSFDSLTTPLPVLLSRPFNPLIYWRPRYLFSLQWFLLKSLPLTICECGLVSEKQNICLHYCPLYVNRWRSKVLLLKGRCRNACGTQ